MSYIRMKNISKTYNINSQAQVNALKSIDLEIKKGELVAIIGKSGSGKSTLLNIMGTLDNQTTGSYFFDNKNLQNLSLKELAQIRNREIGFVLQEFGLILNKSVKENVAIPLIFSQGISRRDIAKRVDEALEEVGLIDKKNSIVAQLSGGQKQRVAIARSVINNPSLILADEPTGALDEATSCDIIRLLKRLNKKGKTVVIITHDMRIAEQCERQICIVDGQIE